MNSEGCSNLCLKKRRPSVVSQLLGMIDLDSITPTGLKDDRCLYNTFMAMVEGCYIAWQADSGRAQAAWMLGHNNSAEDSRTKATLHRKESLILGKLHGPQARPMSSCIRDGRTLGLDKGLSSSETGQELQC